VQRVFENFLECGRLNHGFLQVRCESCHAEHLVAFSWVAATVLPQRNRPVEILPGTSQQDRPAAQSAPPPNAGL
jgi:hypothetical protein